MLIYRECFWCKRRVQKFLKVKDEELKIEVPVNKLPWMWIGGEYNGKIYSVTEIVNHSIQYGTRVDKEFLKDASGLLHIENWKYMDPITLEEKEFPTEGIVIDGPTN